MADLARQEVEPLYWEARRLHRSGKLTEAAGLYRQFLEQNPNHSGAHYGVGMVCFQSGQFEQAQDALSTASRLDPGSTESLSLRGLALLQLGRAHEALGCFDKIVGMEPNSADALGNRAIAKLALLRADEALADCDAVLALRPNHANTHSNRGNALAALRRFEEAVASYDRAVELDPKLHQARGNRLFALGMLHFQKYRFEEALGTFDAALEINPFLPDALYMQAMALFELRRFEEAIVRLNRLLAIKPDFVDALNHRARALVQLCRPNEALADVNAALALEDNNAESWNMHGNILTAINDYPGALTSYEKALRARPDFQEAADNRAAALFLMGKMTRSPPGYMRRLFDSYAPNYETSMIGILEYAGHVHLRTLADRIPEIPQRALRILDLGCGTGLVGEAFKDLVRDGCLDGIDLSPRMIKAAEERGIYSNLFLTDLEEFLTGEERTYDLVLAADTMVYFGELRQILSGVMQHLRSGGHFLFAVEAGVGTGWQLTPAYRFRHSESYLRSAVKEAGFWCHDFFKCNIRLERNEPVAGFALALRN